MTPVIQLLGPRANNHGHHNDPTASITIGPPRGPFLGMHMADEETEIPWGQRLLDSPFTLLALGMAVMLGFYTIWGVIEIMNLPQATLP